jgi:hypothetical protein
MPDSPIGDPVPFNPIPPRRDVLPGREGGVETEIERAIPFPETPDPDILERLQAETASAGGRGGSGRGGRGDLADLPNGEPTEALAFYRSFRHDGKWGVFILKTGLQSVARSMCMMGATPLDAFTAARYFLQNHETAHFLVDRAVLSLESALQLATGKSHDLWISYNQSRHSSYLEEAVANAYAHRMARGAARNLVATFAKTQPAGYRDIDTGRPNTGTTWGSFQQSESQLLSDYLVHRGQEGAQRAVGLHTLMSYNDLRHGTNGDPYFKRPNGVLETVPIWYVR